MDSESKAQALNSQQSDDPLAMMDSQMQGANHAAEESKDPHRLSTNHPSNQNLQVAQTNNID